MCVLQDAQAHDFLSAMADAFLHCKNYSVNIFKKKFKTKCIKCVLLEQDGAVLLRISEREMGFKPGWDITITIGTTESNLIAIIIIVKILRLLGFCPESACLGCSLTSAFTEKNCRYNLAEPNSHF